MSFNRNFKKSVRYNDEIVRILNSEECRKATKLPIVVNVREGTLEEDTKFIGDKVIEYKVQPTANLGIRTLYNFWGNITIRATTEYAGWNSELQHWKYTDFETEIQKILRGVGDFLATFWVPNGYVERYMIVSCKRLVEEGLLEPPYPRYIPRTKQDIFYKDNGDKTGFVGLSLSILEKKNCTLIDKKLKITECDFEKYWGDAFS